jgi:organic hydroperoxide reductase OsmC/OhrA
MTGKTHNYSSRLEWSGATADGYDHYDRTHTVSSPPALARLKLSSDPAFRGAVELQNPEQLLLVAASSCQLLSFLAIMARARLNVVAYTDEASAVMPEDSEPMRITLIMLRPRIVIEGAVDEERVRRYVGLAHEECFIANSLSAEIVIEPRIEAAGG